VLVTVDASYRRNAKIELNNGLVDGSIEGGRI